MLYSRWCDTNLSTRYKIAEIFGIKKVRSTHVADNKVKDDGFEIKDVEEAMTTPKLQEFLKNPSDDLGVLFQLLVDTLEGKLSEVTIQPDPTLIVDEGKPIKTKKITTKKNAKTKKKK